MSKLHEGRLCVSSSPFSQPLTESQVCGGHSRNGCQGITTTGKCRQWEEREQAHPKVRTECVLHAAGRSGWWMPSCLLTCWLIVASAVPPGAGEGLLWPSGGGCSRGGAEVQLPCIRSPVDWTWGIKESDLYAKPFQSVPVVLHLRMDPDWSGGFGGC